ncbi:MAG: hypothetical protein ABWK05_04360 [Pyrobaculum sp.]
MKILIRKVDETGIPEFKEMSLKKLMKKWNKINLEDLYILIDDIDINQLEKY